jgi:exonuclease SbcC
VSTTATTNLQGRTTRETEANIVNLLGMDYDTFRHSVCFEQGKSDSFSLLTPKERKELVIKVLQLNRWGMYQEQAQIQLRDIEGELDKQLDEAERLQRDIEQLKSRGTELVDVGALESHLTTKQREHEIETHKLKETQRQYEVCSTQAATLETTVRHKRQQYQSLASAAQATLAELGRQQELVGRPCPTCGRDITLQCLDACLRELQNRADKASAEANALAASGKQAAEQLVGAEAAVAKCYVELQTHDAKLGKLADAIREVQLQLEGARIYEELIGEKHKALTDLNRDVERLQARYKMLAPLVKAFGRDGVPSYIIGRAIPELEIIANHIVGEVLQSDFNIQLELSKQLKSGGVSDSLEILIDDRGAVRTYDSYSGGEKFLIDFALRIALSIMLARRKGRNIRTMIIDEGFGSLDDRNQSAIVRALHIVARDYGFRKIIMITHVKDVQGHIRNQIVVEKDANGSKVWYNKE